LTGRVRTRRLTGACPNEGRKVALSGEACGGNVGEDGDV
jgi:hypothetical protein